LKKILIVNVNWIGDVLFSTPFLESLKKSTPESHLTCLVVPRCQEILEDNPHLDEILIYDEKGSHASLFGKLRLIQTLRKKRFDRVYLLHRSFTRRLLTFLAGIPERVGYAIKKGGFLLTEKVPAPPGSLHKVDYFLGLLPKGALVPSKHYTLVVKEEDEKALQNLLLRKGIEHEEPFIVFCPFGNWDPKRWPGERFVNLGKTLVKKYNQKVVITGQKNDLAQGEKIAVGIGEKAILLCGETTLKTLAALMRKAALVVSNDTGSMHVAQSQNAKMVALFGPTNPKETGPFGLMPDVILRKNVGCNDDPPCYYVDCPDNICMKTIQVEDVLDAIEKGKL